MFFDSFDFFGYVARIYLAGYRARNQLSIPKMGSVARIRMFVQGFCSQNRPEFPVLIFKL